MRKLQLLAILMCALLMTVPVAWAQELSVSISGKDRASGSIRARDTLIVNAIASIPGEDIISKDQIRFYYQDNFAFFDNCTRVGAGTNYNCLLSDESFEAYQQLQFRVELRNDDDRVVKSETKNLKVDALAPEITLFTVSPNQTTSDATIKYAAQDYGTTPGSIQDCSGIKRVLITLNGRQIAEELGQASTCAKERQLTLKLNESGSVCAQAFDLLNQQSAKKCSKIIVDAQAPDITQPAITDKKGLPITHIKNGVPTFATVSIKILDQVGVDRPSVQADLSTISATLKGFNAPNRVIGDTYVWENVPLSEPGQCVISVRAKDKLGNSAAKDFACTLRSDNTAPTLVGLVPERQRNNIPLFGRGTPIILEIEDKDNTGQPGIGLGKRLAFLDLSSIGLSKSQQANTCEKKDGAAWRCLWQLFPPQNTPEGTYDFSLVQGTSDDLDNLLQINERAAFTILYDDSPPVQPKITSVKIIKGEDTKNITGAIAGNYVQYTVTSANFTDRNANFTDIGAGNDIGVCGEATNETNGLSECVFEKKIELSGPYFANVAFTFTDDAGNKANTSTTLEVLGVDNATNVKYWNSEISCTPRILNRATASVTPPYLTCRVHLTTPRNDIKPYLIRGPQDIEDCGGDVANTLDDVYTTNAFEGSTDPLIVFKLAAKDYYVNQLNITCPITVTSKRTLTSGTQKSYISPTPQTIRVVLNTSFYNEPQRDMYNEVDRQIEKAMSDGLANAKWLTTLRQALYYFELLCRIKTIITSVVQVLAVVTSALGALELVTAVNPFTATASVGIGAVKAALCGAEDGAENAYLSIVKVLDLFCFFINCGGAVPGSKRTEGTGTAAGGTGTAATGGTGTTPASGTSSTTPTPVTDTGVADTPGLRSQEEILGGSAAAVADFTIITGLVVDTPTPPGLAGGATPPPAASGGATPPPEAGTVGSAGDGRERTGGEEFTSAISGGVNPVCRAMASGLGMAAPNIRDSLFWSVLCLCLPGIVYNVEKLQQVNCYKAVCLHDEVKEQGYPVSYCDEMYQYNLCQYVIGQVWAALPLTGLADKITNMVVDIVTNPAVVLTIGQAILCNQFCKIKEPSGSTALFTTCATLQVINILADTVTSIYSMSRTKNLFQTPTGIYCKRMEKIQKEMDAKKKENEGTNSTGGPPK